MNRFKYQHLIIWSVLGVLSVFLLIKGASDNVNHDEAQFIASARLIQTEGLLPIFDYVYYHQPAFSHFYALFMEVFDTPIMFQLRIFSALCVIMSVVVLVLTYIRFQSKNPGFGRWEKLLFPVSIILVLTINTLMRHGLISWNHAFPTLLLFVGFLLVLKDSSKFNPKLIAFAGVLFALGVGMRASLAPMVLPIFGALFFYNLPMKKRFSLAVWFFVGCLVGSIPVFIYMIKDFEAFYFNLVQFHTKFDTQYLADMGRARPLGKQLNIAYGYMVKSSAFYLTMSFVVLLIAYVISALRTKKKPGYRLLFAFAAFSMAIISALTKNVTFIQYYYMPALMLALLIGELYHATERNLRLIVLPIIAILGVVHVARSARLYTDGYDFTLGEKVPVPLRVHQEGQFIHEKAGDGYVLTLSPQYVLEGACKIYPEFVTSPFAYRTRDWVPKEYRDKYNVIGQRDLYRYMRDKSPCAVYTGWEGGLDAKLNEWASDHGYRLIETPFSKKLWIRD